MGMFDKEIVEVACPGCRKKIKKELRWFKANNVACPNCKVTFENHQFRRDIDAVEKQLADFKRQFGG